MSLSCFDFLRSQPTRLAFRGEVWRLEDLVGGDFTVDQLEAGGLCAAALKRSGAARLKDIGFSAGKLRAGGFTSSELRIAGFSPVELKEAGYGLCDMYYTAGFNKPDLVSAGYTASDCCKENVSLPMITYMIGEHDLRALREAGYGPMKLGYNFGRSTHKRREFLEAGFTLAQLDAIDRMFCSDNN